MHIGPECAVLMTKTSGSCVVHGGSGQQGRSINPKTGAESNGRGGSALSSSSALRLAAVMAFLILSITQFRAFNPSEYEKGKFDELVEDKGVKILIEPKALMHVIGTKMDFVDDKLR
ncbi:hypothetical protein QQ045_002964 [Rhodiola kirilowii]